METIGNGESEVSSDVVSQASERSEGDNKPSQSTVIGIPRRMDNRKSETKWNPVHAVRVGDITIEFTRYENTDRLSLRLSCDSKSWIPVKDATFDNLFDALVSGMEFVNEELTKREASLLARAQKEAEKRKRHSDNFERRREENRERTRKGKGGRG